MATVTKPASRPRVELQLHEHATLREYRELGVFVRDCIDRIERTLGRARWWSVTIVPACACFSCELSVQLENTVVRASGTGFDGAVAGWEAFRKIESLLGSLGETRESPGAADEREVPFQLTRYDDCLARRLGMNER